jgi:hypothetical protein
MERSKVNIRMIDGCIIAYNPRSETEFYVGNRFFALCTSSVSKILRAGTFLYESRYSVCPSVRPPGYYFFFLFIDVF